MDEPRVHQLVAELASSKERDRILSELSKARDYELGPLLWNSFGVMSVLLQEVVSIYPLLGQPSLAANASTRICHALTLMQCVASHPDSRPLFIKAQFPLYLYPILNTTTRSKPFEYLRLTSLGIIGALVKSDCAKAVEFLITTEIIPLCLRIMETGNELCKTVAIFVIQKTIADEAGLHYICAAYERFHAVVVVLNNMIHQMSASPSPRLLKHIVKCYQQLSEHRETRDSLRQYIPESLQSKEFVHLLGDDPVARRYHAQLMSNLFGSES